MSVTQINAQTPITAILSTYLYSANGTCLLNLGEYAGICHLPLKELQLISLAYTETP